MKKCLALFTLIGIAAIVVAMCGPANADLQLQNYNANSHDRFVNSNQFIGAAYDWSGVSSGGVDSVVKPGWAVMVTPRHFLSATHYHPGNNSTMQFFHTNDPNGASDVRTVTSGRQIENTDIWLGELDSDVSSDVAIYPILNPQLALGSEMWIMGLSESNNANTEKQISQRMGRNTIEAVFEDAALLGRTSDIITFDFDETGGVGDDEARLAGLDSGGSSFVIVNGAPALVGIHWFIYENDEDNSFPGDAAKGSGDSFVPGYFDAINAELATMNGGFQLTTAVPEPSTPILALMSIGCLLGIRRRSEEAV